MISLDTNAVLRLLLNDIPEQRQKVVKLLQKHSAEQIAIADIVFAEVTHALTKYYQLDRLLVANSLLEFIKTAEINCNRAMLKLALPLFAAHSSLSFEDCALAVYAELNGAEPLYTFDKALAAKLPQAKLIT